MLTRLIAGEHEGRRLTEPELLQNCIFILNAGHETTTNLIGNALHILALWPGERRRLIADPELIKGAVEEVLRFESSNQLGNRIVATDAVLGGVAMPAGTLVTIGIGAANRDPAQFPDPDRFDVSRAPNRHLAFATGIHHVRRHGARAARRPRRARAVPASISELPGRRDAAAQPPRAVPRVRIDPGRSRRAIRWCR